MCDPPALGHDGLLRRGARGAADRPGRAAPPNDHEIIRLAVAAERLAAPGIDDRQVGRLVGDMMRAADRGLVEAPDVERIAKEMLRPPLAAGQ